MEGADVHEVRIEVILLSIADDDQLRWRVAGGELATGCGPDARARELAGLGATVPTATVVHSTSWRPTTAGLVLTYAVVPDPNPAEGTVAAVPSDPTIISSADTATPSPSRGRGAARCGARATAPVAGRAHQPGRGRGGRFAPTTVARCGGPLPRRLAVAGTTSAERAAVVRACAELEAASHLVSYVGASTSDDPALRALAPGISLPPTRVNG